jgi:hypothetical protein
VRLPASVIALLSLAVVTLACNPLPDEGSVNRDLYGNFETAVASGPHFRPYWLGRSVTVAGVTLSGPEANAKAGSGGIGQGIGRNDPDTLETSYSAGGCCSAGVTVTLYSRRGWEQRAPATYRTPPPSPGVTTRQVTVGAQPATLWTIFDGPRKSALALLVDYGDTVVLARTSSLIPRTPGPDPNPLMDEATFLAVMQHLRPYPQ